MSFKNKWKPRIDGVDDANSSGVNEIAEAVIENEEAVKKNASDISNKQDALSQEQLQNIADVPNKAPKATTLEGYGITDAYTKEQADEKFQEKLSAEQIQNINDVQNKVAKEQGKGLSTNDYTTEEKQEVAKIVNKSDKSYVNNTFANALKGSANGAAIGIHDVSPVEHTMAVNVRSKNLISYPYYETTKTQDGITWTDNGDGTITANGTATNLTSFMLKYKFNLEIGKSYIVSGLPENTSVSTGHRIFVSATDYSQIIEGTKPVVATKTEYYAIITLEAGTVCDNITFKPQLEEGTVATPYTPYVDPTSVTLSEYGKNLFNKNFLGDTDVNRLTKTINDDGTYKLSGILKNQTFSYYGKHDFFIPKNTKVTISSWYKTIPANDEYNIGLVLYAKGNNILLHGNALKHGQHMTTTLTEDCISVGIVYRCGGASVGDNITFDNVKLQLELGDGTDYEPYKAVKTFTPSADGTVTGIKNIYPTTTLLANKDNVVIDVEYNRDLNKAFEELTNAIISSGGNV